MAAQYTIDPKIVPFERRWRNDTEALYLPTNQMKKLASNAVGANFIDPQNLNDVLHARLIERNTRVNSYICPFGGRRDRM